MWITALNMHQNVNSCSKLSSKFITKCHIVEEIMVFWNIHGISNSSYSDSEKMCWSSQNPLQHATVPPSITRTPYAYHMCTTWVSCAHHMGITCTQHCLPSSVPSKDYQLGPIRQNLNYFRGSLSQNFKFLLKIGWFTKKKHTFYTLSQNLLSQFFKDFSQLCAIGP